MSITKQMKDYLIKFFWDGKSVPQELFELSQYFRNNDPIEFELKKENGEIVAVSKNYRYGSIITSGKTKDELEKNIEDAILTSFEIPFSYKKEVEIHKVDKKNHTYAYA